MSRQVTRILISFLMLPIAGVLYVTGFWTAEDSLPNIPRGWLYVIAGTVSWLFLRMTWYLLWRQTISSKPRRHHLSIAVTLGTVVVAALLMITFPLPGRYGDVGPLLGSVLAPLLGQVAIVLIYQETATERADRLSGKKPAGVVCPACGYNLAGLTAAQCPECGRQYTLDGLIAAQPAKGLVEM